MKNRHKVNERDRNCEKRLTLDICCYVIMKHVNVILITLYIYVSYDHYHISHVYVT